MNLFGNPEIILLLLVMSLLVGCATLKQEQVQLPSGYELVVIEEKIRVKCPNEYITGPQWATTYMATQYEIFHNFVWRNYLSAPQPFGQ